MVSYKLLIHSAKQVVLITRHGQRLLCGNEMKTVEVINAVVGNGVSVIVNNDGLIHDLGMDDEIRSKYTDSIFTERLDATGMCVLPGLVDAHTHPVWEGDRVHEFAMKLAGATYMDVHRAGGGIHFTVDHTRKSHEDVLYASFTDRLCKMLESGTTLVECKSGYGLNAETELKMLRVIERAKRENPIGISSTFCGAHAVPRGMTSDEATDDVIKIQLPLIDAAMARGDLHVDNIDVFCEQGVFNIVQSKRILEAGKKLGLQINFHGDELHPLGSAEMGASLEAHAISHLEEISNAGIEAMVKSRSVGVVLPTTAYILRLDPPPVRKMIDGGMAVALGSDFNPNAFCFSMPMVMHLACVTLRMTMEEALVASTLNAAAALGKSQTNGSIEVGKVADLILIKADRWEHLIYQFGCHHELIHYTITSGNIVYQKTKI